MLVPKVKKKHPFLRIPNERNIPFSAEIADFEVQYNPPHFLSKTRFIFVLQWNLYKATAELCGLSRQMVFHGTLGRENKHDFVKTGPGKWRNLCVLVRLPRSHYTGSTVKDKMPFCETRDIFFMYIVTFITSNDVFYGPLTRYVKLRVAHAPGMPGTFSPPPISKETAS